MVALPAYAIGTAPSAADFAWPITSRPIAEAYQGTAQTGIATAVWTAVTLDTAVLDRDGGFTLPTSSYVMGLTPGIYAVTAQVAFASGAAAGLAAKLVVNGVDVAGSLIKASSPGGAAVTVVIPPVMVRTLRAVDIIQLSCWQTTGSPLNLASTGGQRSQMRIEWEGLAP